MIKAALFDLDGTLIDTEDQYSRFWGEMGRRYHPEMLDFANRIKGTTLTQIFDLYIPDAKDQQDVTKLLDAYEDKMDYTPYPGAIDFIKDLRNHGVKLAVVTSSNLAKMAAFKRQQPQFCSLFDRILTSEDFAASKPNPDCYLLGAKVFDCSIDECIVFEDAFTGLQAGMSAGMFTFGITNVNPREAIQDKCSYVIDTFEGLTYDEIRKIRGSV